MSARKPQVDLVFDSDCPHVGAARVAIRTAISAVGIGVWSREWDRENGETPEPYYRLASPTVLVDGHDVSPSDLAPSATMVAACCRLYKDEFGGLSGAPAPELIVNAIRAASEPTAVAVPDRAYAAVRRVHASASVTIAIMSLIHLAVTPFQYDVWNADALWFAATGVSLLLIAGLNLAHIGVEPCRMPTTKLIRIANWTYVGVGLAAAAAVPEPQTMVLALAFAVQAVASQKTLPGPT